MDYFILFYSIYLTGGAEVWNISAESKGNLEIFLEYSSNVSVKLESNYSL